MAADAIVLQFFIGRLLVGPHLAGSRYAALYLAWWGAWIEDSTATLINSTDFCDGPMLRIHAGCVLDVGVINWGHVFSYPTLNFGPKIIGRDAILHPYAVTWESDHVPDGVTLGPRSQLGTGDLESAVPGESLTPGTYVQGCPATILQPVRHDSDTKFDPSDKIRPSDDE